MLYIYIYSFQPMEGILHAIRVLRRGMDKGPRRFSGEHGHRHLEKAEEAFDPYILWMVAKSISHHLRNTLD